MLLRKEVIKLSCFKPLLFLFIVLRSAHLDPRVYEIIYLPVHEQLPFLIERKI